MRHGWRIGRRVGVSQSDGILDIIVIHPVSKPKLARVFPRVYRGTHTTIPGALKLIVAKPRRQAGD